MFFLLNIDPVPKGRPRVGKWGNVYTPPRTANYEKALVMLLKQKMKENGYVTANGPIEVDLRFQFAKGKYSKIQYPRGDVDNYAKAALDAMNGIVFEDDNQIIRLTVEKHFNAASLVLIRVLPYSEPVETIIEVASAQAS